MQMFFGAVRCGPACSVPPMHGQRCHRLSLTTLHTCSAVSSLLFVLQVRSAVLLSMRDTCFSCWAHRLQAGDLVSRSQSAWFWQSRADRLFGYLKANILRTSGKRYSRRSSSVVVGIFLVTWVSPPVCCRRSERAPLLGWQPRSCFGLEFALVCLGNAPQRGSLLYAVLLRVGAVRSFVRLIFPRPSPPWRSGLCPAPFGSRPTFSSGHIA